MAGGSGTGHKWDFKGTRQRAIKAIDELPMGEVQKILVMRKYGISGWARPTYEALLLREHPLTADEMKSLGFEFSSKMAAAREQLGLASHNKKGWTCCSSWNCKNCNRTVRPPEDCECGKGVRSSIPIGPVIRDIFGESVVIL